jgi:hypothetical protein
MWGFQLICSENRSVAGCRLGKWKQNHLILNHLIEPSDSILKGTTRPVRANQLSQSQRAQIVPSNVRLAPGPTVTVVRYDGLDRACIRRRKRRINLRPAMLAVIVAT